VSQRDTTHQRTAEFLHSGSMEGDFIVEEWNKTEEAVMAMHYAKSVQTWGEKIREPTAV